MNSFDEIFTSNLDENKKKSKMIFGKLLLNMRKNNHIRLYSLMSEVFDTDYRDNVLTLIIGDKSTFEMMNNRNDIDTINQELSSIDSAYTIDIRCEEQKKFDMYQFEEKLRKEFGKILTIK